MDSHHARVVATLRANRGARFIPAAILSEITYVLEIRAGSRLLLDFLQDLENGAYTRDYGEDDLPRIRALMQRYADLSLGFADAAVIACAERHGGRVLTTNHRHFPVVGRGEGTIRVLPPPEGLGT
jgi:predicted nucleic acid-binding protein